MSKKRFQLLSDAQWELIEALLPEPKRRRDKRGRPWASNRACLEGILWVLQTGAAWRFLPDKYPSPATCWRRLKQWEEQDVWLDAWRTLLGALDGEGLLKWEETFLFAPAKKGERLAKRGIDLIVPYRKNSRHRRYEDGRKLRRYKRRWIIERTNAWLGQFRRLLVRHEHFLATYRAFFYLACLWITMRLCL